MTKPYDPAAEGAEMSFGRKMAYGDYLHLDAILGAQEPLSKAHDELLFIVQHQTSELWMKLAIHEMSSAALALRMAGEDEAAARAGGFLRRQVSAAGLLYATDVPSLSTEIGRAHV